MGVYTVQANPAGTASQSSIYGSSPWQYNPSANFAVIPQAGGTPWMIWSCQVGGLTPGKPLNGIRVTGVNDFTVAGGGVSRTRQASAYMSAARTFAFTGTGGSLAQTVTGSGVGADMLWSLSTPGWTTDDLMAGNVFIGVAVGTNAGDPGLGDGTYRYGAMTFTFYTDTDGAPGGGGSVSTTLTNPAANINPGKYGGQQFAALTYVFNSPKPQTSFNMQFKIYGNGVTFASSGTSTLVLFKGTTTDPGNPYTGSTGLINVAANAMPGAYLIDAGCANVIGGNGYQTSSLVVAARAAPFSEA
jgi:hypothetical protein